MQAKHAKEFAWGSSHRPLATVAPECRAKDAVAVMKDAKVHHLLVTEEGKCVGLLGAADLLYAEEASFEVRKLMRRDFLSVSEETDIRTALRYMLERELTALPLTRGENVVGILTQSDLLRLLERFVEDRERVNGLVAQGEVAAAHPLVQGLMKALADAGI